MTAQLPPTLYRTVPGVVACGAHLDGHTPLATVANGPDCHTCETMTGPRPRCLLCADGPVNPDGTCYVCPECDPATLPGLCPDCRRPVAGDGPALVAIAGETWHRPCVVATLAALETDTVRALADLSDWQMTGAWHWTPDPFVALALAALAAPVCDLCSQPADTLESFFDSGLRLCPGCMGAAVRDAIADGLVSPDVRY